MELPTERMWMYRRKVSGSSAVTPEFMNGVFNFDKFAKKQPEFKRTKKYRCPCVKCRNVQHQKSKVVKTHLYKFGFKEDYWYWTRHGEKNPQLCHQSETNIIDDMDVHDEVNDEVNDESHDETYKNHMQSMINDVMEVNEAYSNELPNSHADAFLNMLNSSQQPLYDGCNISELELSTRLLSIKADFNPSHAHFKAWMSLIIDLLPNVAASRIPKDLPRLMRKVKQLGLDFQIIDSCPNHCMLYYKEHSSLTKCKFCGHDRKKTSKGTKEGAPFSKMYYLPITDRLQRLYASRNIASHMRWHKEHQQEEGIMRHPSDAQAWQHFDKKYPEFALEPRNVRLGLCADGFTPYKDDSRSYSIWPIVITPYNLPPNMCMKTPFLFLTCLIPGPKSPNNRIDVYLQPLIDELKVLWNEGVLTYDISTSTNFTMRVTLMWTINDFPAYGMLSGWSTHGKLSCPVCMDQNPATRLTHGRKQSWFDHHRCFLTKKHSLRKNKVNFTKGITVDKPSDKAPERYSGKRIFSMVKTLHSVITRVQFKIDGFGKEHNWTKRSIFWELPYWEDQLLRHNLDVMHIEKNFSEQIINTVMDVPYRTKDDLNARKDMEIICDRKELHLIMNGNKAFKPKAKFALTLEQKKDVCEWMKGVRLPDGYGSNPKNLVDGSNQKFGHMKSHDHHVFLQTLLPVAFSALPDEVLKPLVELSDFFKNICSSALEISKVAELRRKIPVILCKLEAQFPPSFWNVMEHLPVHLAEEAMLRGPSQYVWMYPFEGFFGKLKPFATNKAHPEVSMVRAFLAYEISKFTSTYFNGDVECMATKVGRNQVSESSLPNFGDTLSVFKWKGRPTGLDRKTRWFTRGNEKNSAHLHVLLNCPEVEPYLNLFKEKVLVEFQNTSSDELDVLITTHFPSWFKNEVRQTRLFTDPVQQCLIDMSFGPTNIAKSYSGYVVDGVKFQSRQKCVDMETYGAGVFLKGMSERNDVACDYYGVLEEVICIKYVGQPTKKCMLFKCDWFDTSKEGVKYHTNSPYAFINHTKRYANSKNDPFIFADTASQVMYVKYPPRVAGKKDWWVAIPNKPRGNPDGDQDNINDTYQENLIGEINVDKFQHVHLVDESVPPEDITHMLPNHGIEVEEEVEEVEDQVEEEENEGEWDVENETDDELVITYANSEDDHGDDDVSDADADDDDGDNIDHLDGVEDDDYITDT